MSVTIEKLDGNMAKLTFEETPEAFEEAVQKSYLKNKNKIQVQGFRKGHAPRALIEKEYGVGVFYEDAANDLMSEAYTREITEGEAKDLEIVSSPVDIEILEIEKDKPFRFSLKVALKPVVELGKYKGFDVPKKTAEISDDDLRNELDRVREMHSRMVTVEDRPVKDGDIAVIDFEGFMDGKPFNGGKGEDHELVIGSHSFIDTFEEQLIGKNTGDDVDVNVTFPEEYQAKELAGKPALFKVKIKGIKVKELPELNDEFAEEISDFDNLKDYEADVRKRLQEREQSILDCERRDEILKRAVEGAKMEIPDAMLDSEARRMVEEQSRRFEMQGLSMEMYMKYTGQTKDKIVEDMKAQAKIRIQNSLVLEAIAKQDDIQATDEELKAELETMAKNYGLDVEKIEEMLSDKDKDGIRQDIVIRKAADRIAE